MRVEGVVIKLNEENEEKVSKERSDENFGKRRKKVVFGCFVCFCAVTAENDAISLSLFSFAKNMYAHVYVFLAKKKGEID